MHEPSEPKLLSEKLKWLAVQKQKASTWWAAEIHKLIPYAEGLEAKIRQMTWQGFLAGLVTGAVVMWYLLRFGVQ